MRIVAKKTIVAFYTWHADAKVALEDWYEKVESAEWENFAQLRMSFASADHVGNKRIVFNIRGNEYRLVAIVLFKFKMVYVRFIGTHQEYDKLSEEQIKQI
ncbi:MAG: type II toxin-antitoxin system HigB family toxin [Bacteroidales bacterium]|nr:type II toxin-antitoxin system HigB family toxin [Bacteroidales bacterium]